MRTCLYGISVIRFDRILVAQAQIEGLTLLTADAVVGRYPGPIQVLKKSEPQ